LAGRDRIAREAQVLFADLKREARRLPGGQRPRHGVGVDERPSYQLGLVCDPVAFGIEADACDAEEALPVDLADVDQPSVRRRQHPDCPFGLGGDVEHPREVVAAPAGHDSERDVAAGQRPAHGTDQPVATHHHRHLAEVGGALGLIDGVFDAASSLDAKSHMALVELFLDPREQRLGTPTT